MKALETTGNLHVMVLADGVPIVPDCSHHIPLHGGQWSIMLPPHRHASDMHHLRITDLIAHAEMPGWIAGRMSVRYNQWDIGEWKPFTLYGLDSEHWSAIVHYPMPHGFDLLKWGSNERISTLSYAFRANFRPANEKGE